MAWITTEAVRTQQPVLQLGPSLTDFMAKLGLLSSGGRWGTIPRFRDQMKRLFTTTISVTYNPASRREWTDSGFRITSHSHLWWSPTGPVRSGSSWWRWPRSLRSLLSCFRAES